MERTKPQNNDFNEVKKSFATLYNICKYIPGCEFVLDNYLDDNGYDNPLIPGYEEEWPKLTAEMDLLAKEAFNNWLINASPKAITATLLPIRLTEKNRPFLVALKKIINPKYQYFLESDFKGLPKDFTAPTPFLVMEDTKDKHLLMRPLVREYGGKIRMEIRGTVLRAEDGQLTMALMILLGRKIPAISEKVISFTTTLEEIANVLGKKYPKKESTRNAIWNGLTRLNDCRITLTNAKGLRTLGGILNGARELEEDSNLEVRIHLDADFIRLYAEGYTNLDPNIYFPLKPTLANLYAFLQHQMSFNTTGTLAPISIFKIFDYAGLGGKKPKRKPVWYQRRVIRQALGTLYDLGIIHNQIVYKADQVSIVNPITKADLRRKNYHENNHSQE
jgi:hypothetical protein